MIRTVRYRNEDITLAQLSTRTGLSKDCLDRRYRLGDRDERLWRPLDSMKRSAGTQGADAANNVKRAQQAAQHARVQERQQREREAQARAKAARDAEFARALIDARLVTSGERLAIRQGVIGRQRWYPMGAARS